MPSPRSLRFQLILMFSAVVATAMGVLFLYVVPSLRDDLVTTGSTGWSGSRASSSRRPDSSGR